MNYILSQIFVVLAYILLSATYLVKNRKYTILINFTSLVCNSVSYLLLSAWTGLSMMIVAMIRNILFLIYDNKPTNKKHDVKQWFILIILYIISILFAIVTYEGFYTLFSVIASILYTYSIWQKNIKIYRVLGLFIEIFGLLYFVFINSIFGVILEAVLFLIQIYGVVNIFKSKEKKEIANNGIN